MLVAVLATVPRAGDRDALRRPKAWTIGSTPTAGGALIEPAGGAGGLVLSGALTMPPLPVAARAVHRAEG
jgi:hypothetical protein